MSDDVQQRVQRFLDAVLANPNRREALESMRARWEDVRHQLQHLPAGASDSTESDLVYEVTFLRTTMFRLEFEALRQAEAKVRSAPEN
jgi:hypothetical protein